MTKQRILVVADPTERFQPKYDSSLLLSAEFLKRGYRVDYLNTNHFLNQEVSFDLESLPVQEVQAARPGSPENFI